MPIVHAPQRKYIRLSIMKTSGQPASLLALESAEVQAPEMDKKITQRTNLRRIFWPLGGRGAKTGHPSQLALPTIRLFIRTSTEIKQLLRLATDCEQRSVASMIEILVLDYARTHELRLDHDIDEIEKRAS